MNILTFDVETTHKEKPSGGYTPLPYFGNHLVSIGYKMFKEHARVQTAGVEVDGYLCFYHDDKEPTPGGFETFQAVLDDADVVVGHNIKFDLNWIKDVVLSMMDLSTILWWLSTSLREHVSGRSPSMPSLKGMRLLKRRKTLRRIISRAARHSRRYRGRS